MQMSCVNDAVRNGSQAGSQSNLPSAPARHTHTSLSHRHQHQHQTFNTCNTNTGRKQGGRKKGNKKDREEEKDRGAVDNRRGEERRGEKEGEVCVGWGGGWQKNRRSRSPPLGAVRRGSLLPWCDRKFYLSAPLHLCSVLLRTRPEKRSF